MTPENPNIILAQLARGRALASLSNVDEAVAWLNKSGAHRAARILKASVGAISTADSDVAVMIGAWTASMASASAFYKLLDSGFRKLPVHQRIAIAASSPTAGIVSEGRAAPISRVVIGSTILQPTTVVSMLVCTREMLFDPGAEGLFNKELKSVIGQAVDAAMIELLFGDTAAISLPSSGTTPDAAVADVRSALLNLGTVGDASRLAWLLAPDVARKGSALGAVAAFPGLTPAGGDIRGTLALVSNGIPPGQAVLLDAAQVAASGGMVDFLASGSADVEMSDAPGSDSTVPTAAQLVSTFQTNSIAMRAVAVIAAQRLRDDCAVQITGIDWGAAP